MSIVPSMTRTQTPLMMIPSGPPTWMQLLLLHLRSQGWGHHGSHKPKHQWMDSVCKINQCSRMGMTEECPETPRKWTKAARNRMVKGTGKQQYGMWCGAMGSWQWCLEPDLWLGRLPSWQWPWPCLQWQWTQHLQPWGQCSTWVRQCWQWCPTQWFKVLTLQSFQIEQHRSTKGVCLINLFLAKLLECYSPLQQSHHGRDGPSSLKRCMHRSWLAANIIIARVSMRLRKVILTM